MICHSCFTLRTSQKETKKYFSEHQLTYIDSTIFVKDLPIHYLQTGNPNQPTLFFVHGSPGSWDAYKSYLTDKQLVKKFRLIAVDRLGFGSSDFRNAKNLFEHSDYLSEFIKKIDNKQSITLVGHSYGGPLIVKLAIDNPKIIKKIVVVAGSLDPNLEKKENWRYVFNAFPLKYLVPGALLPSNQELIYLKKDLFELEKQLPNLTSDVIIIHGDQDDLVPYDNVKFMKNKFIHANSLKTIDLKGKNHFILWTDEDTIKKNID